jgi:predicted nucleic acid-binding protein
MEARLRAYPVIPGTFGVAAKFAELRRRFHKQMEDNDLWIAACALAQPEPLALATADANFDDIAAEFPLVVVRR